MFQPKIRSPHQDPDDFLREELRRLAAELQGQQPLARFAPQYVEPAKPREGDVVLADGVSWNPGSGRGFYEYVEGTGWVAFGGSGGEGAYSVKLKTIWGPAFTYNWEWVDSLWQEPDKYPPSNPAWLADFYAGDQQSFTVLEEGVYELNLNLVCSSLTYDNNVQVAIVDDVGYHIARRGMTVPFNMPNPPIGYFVYESTMVLHTIVKLPAGTRLRVFGYSTGTDIWFNNGAQSSFSIGKLG